jgi:hypothetical protein
MKKATTTAPVVMMKNFFIYDASTYREGVSAMDIPVSELALNPRLGGPKMIMKNPQNVKTLRIAVIVRDCFQDAALAAVSDLNRIARCRSDLNQKPQLKLHLGNNPALLLLYAKSLHSAGFPVED